MGYKVEFALTPHIKAILCGRGMCKDGKLICSATNCIFASKNSEHPEFERVIEVRGEGKCPACKYDISYPDDLVFDDFLQKDILKCSHCNKTLSLNIITWTQKVVSKHYRSKKHIYMHKECYENQYFNIPDDENESESEEIGK